MAGFELQPYEILSFKGGLTDQWSSAGKNQYMRADNLLLTKEENPISRPGSFIFDLADSVLPISATRLVNYQDDAWLLAFGGPSAYRKSSTLIWAEILGAAGGTAFPSAGPTTRFQPITWKRHLVVTNDQGLPPIAFYPNSLGVWQARQVGLPALTLTENFVNATELANAITLANQIRTQLLRHLSNANNNGAAHAPHTAADTVASALIPAAATNLATLLTLTTALMRAFTVHQRDAFGGAPTLHYGTGVVFAYGQVAAYQSTDWQLASLAPPLDLITAVDRLLDLKEVYNLHLTYQGTLTWRYIHRDDLAEAGSSVSASMSPLTAGPVLGKDLTLMCQAVNQLRLSLNYHANATGGGNPHLGADPNFPATTVPTTWATLVASVNELTTLYNFHEDDAAKGVPIYHRATHASDHHLLIYSQGLVEDLLTPRSSTLKALAARVKALSAAYNAHEADATAHGGFINVAQDAAIIPPVGDYVYALHRSLTYTLNSRTFKVASPVTLLLARDRVDPSFAPITIYNIPTLTNTATSNYDWINTKVEVYRTQVNQQAPLFLGAIANGVSSFDDAFADDDLPSQLVYTAGGIPNSDPPPNAKYIARVESNFYYGNFIGSDGTDYTNRILQCSPGSPDNAPGAFSLDLPEALAGMIGIRDSMLIAWTKKSTYRIEGGFDLQGRGAMLPVEISGSVGLAASYSPVKLDDGCVFWGTDGIYFTDGYQVHRLSRHWTASYLQIVGFLPDQVHGVFNRTERRIYWVMQTPSTGSFTINAILVLDLNHDPTNTENAVFTTWSNGTHFQPAALAIYQGDLLRVDPRGYVFRHNEASLSDPRVDISVDPSFWFRIPIIYDWISTSFNFDNPRARKQVLRCYVECKNNGTPLFLQINSNNDDGKQFAALAPIHFTGTPKLAGEDSVRGVLQFGNYSPDTLRGDIKEWRRFPAGHLRCSRKQIQFTNAFAILATSDTLGTATISVAAGVPGVSIASGSWPIDVVDQVLYVASDNYTQPFRILSQSGPTLTTDNPGLVMAAGTDVRWKIVGYAKDQKFQLLNYVLSYATIGTEHMDAQEGPGDVRP